MMKPAYQRVPIPYISRSTSCHHLHCAAKWFSLYGRSASTSTKCVAAILRKRKYHCEFTSIKLINESELESHGLSAKQPFGQVTVIVYISRVHR
ncbi:hypothetical protein FIBSPDRAFT_483077 [Athelia psychrophila]|uniref:Uncharacterized protein n=1 Tax=Athelia psychrophila TaxID=1759441 RepID=A0A166L129_9AGAM|nr:hypothetical protein FIBSPDRAFT_483077 [Fibularhizoctonia sp. CBS 109695]